MENCRVSGATPDRGECAGNILGILSRPIAPCTTPHRGSTPVAGCRRRVPPARNAWPLRSPVVSHLASWHGVLRDCDTQSRCEPAHRRVARRRWRGGLGAHFGSAVTRAGHAVPGRARWRSTEGQGANTSGVGAPPPIQRSTTPLAALHACVCDSVAWLVAHPCIRASVRPCDCAMGGVATAHAGHTPRCYPPGAPVVCREWLLWA